MPNFKKTTCIILCACSILICTGVGQKAYGWGWCSIPCQLRKYGMTRVDRSFDLNYLSVLENMLNSLFPELSKINGISVTIPHIENGKKESPVKEEMNSQKIKVKNELDILIGESPENIGRGTFYITEDVQNKTRDRTYNIPKAMLPYSRPLALEGFLRTSGGRGIGKDSRTEEKALAYRDAASTEIVQDIAVILAGIEQDEAGYTKLDIESLSESGVTQKFDSEEEAVRAIAAYKSEITKLLARRSILLAKLLDLKALRIMVHREKAYSKAEMYEAIIRTDIYRRNRFINLMLNKHGLMIQ